VLRRALFIALWLASGAASAQLGITVPARPKVSLEEALPIATEIARSKTGDFDKLLLHSLRPHVAFRRAPG
jgi:hypothetical protein